MIPILHRCRGRRWSLILPLLPVGFLIVTVAGGQEAQEPAPGEDFKKMKNPIAYTKKSIGRGRNFFLRFCADCHDRDGKALTAVVADATNLTEPARWRNGTSEGEIFRSIRDGAGLEMPPFKKEIRREEDIWHMVNFIRSIGPASYKPPLQEESLSESKQ